MKAAEKDVLRISMAPTAQVEELVMNPVSASAGLVSVGMLVH